MIDLVSLLTAAAVVVILGLLVTRAEKRADRAEAARDAAIGQRDAATAAANQHWRALRRARGELERYRRNLSEADHWATVPREPSPQELEEIKAKYRKAVTEQSTALLPVLGDEQPTAMLPAVDGWVR